MDSGPFLFYLALCLVTACAQHPPFRTKWARAASDVLASSCLPLQKSLCFQKNQRNFFFASFLLDMRLAFPKTDWAILLFICTHFVDGTVCKQHLADFSKAVMGTGKELLGTAVRSNHTPYAVKTGTETEMTIFSRPHPFLFLPFLQKNRILGRKE